jgi:hypothetical protein
MMRRVIVESPFAGDTEKHRLYAIDAMRDCFARGEAPFASHMLYPQALEDSNPVERDIGIEAGLIWGEMAHATVVYVDLGISQGMRLGINRAYIQGRPIEFRKIEGWQ